MRERMRRVGITLIAALVVSLATLPTTRATSHCTFDDATATATITSATAVITRSGDAIAVDGAACGDATVTTTDTIVMSDATDVTIDLGGGLLAPGASDEGNGSSEIELELGGPGGSGTMLTIEGTGERDVIKAATRGGGPSEGSVNLNAVEVPKDDDVTYDHGTFDVLVIDGHAGDDSLIALGHGTEPYSDDLWFLGRDGDDRFVPGISEPGETRFLAGNGFDTFDVSWFPNDILVAITLGRNGGGHAGGALTIGGVERAIGHDGNDTLIGNAGPDQLIGLGDSDYVRGRQGDDRVLGGAGADNIAGGAGTDRCDGSSEDLAVWTCEL